MTDEGEDENEVARKLKKSMNNFSPREDENEVVTKKRKVSKTTPKKTPKKVTKESKKKDPKKIQKKKKTVTFKGDKQAIKKTSQSKQVGCVVLFGIGWCHVPCSCKPRR